MSQHRQHYQAPRRRAMYPVAWWVIVVGCGIAGIYLTLTTTAP